uniref:Uncharacterized protein n=1 Tax=Phlebotomus papatasi TaxID=29031 RepID=A0A1B0DQF4_PHLPP
MRCIVKDCENTLKNCPQGVTFHRFPQDVRLARKWKILINIGLNYVCKEKDRVCSEHFLEENFEYRRFRDKFKKYLRTNSTPQPLFDMELDEYRMQLYEQDDPYLDMQYIEESYMTEPMPEPSRSIMHNVSMTSDEDDMGNGSVTSVHYESSHNQYGNRNIYAPGSSKYVMVR